MNVFNGCSLIKEINWLIKINTLLSKGISNIYLKVTLKKNLHPQNFDFSKFKKIVTRSISEEVQLTRYH